jgi:putative hydrolase
VADGNDEPGETNPEEEFREMLRNLLSGAGDIDPAQLAGAAGLPNDPASVAALFSQLQQAMNHADDGIDWSVALRQGEQRAASAQLQITDEERARFDQAMQVASLWLDEAVDFSRLPDSPELLTRRGWVAATMPIWTQLAEPVALSISDALTRVMREQAPEEMQSMIAGASKLMRGIGGAMFAMQLGQVVGQLASEVVSGGDVGIPLQADGRAALIPQNIAEFGADLDIPSTEVELYLAVRELAHGRLFRHARWLRLNLITAITAYAQGIEIDTERLENLAEGFDPSNTDELRRAVESGALISPRSPAQEAALSRLETMLALIEGWVDQATADATSRLPKSDAIAETIRRRRATGGPAESAFATLVGLELRPRRLREATALWRSIGDAVGVERRDAIWAHPDLLPTAEDLDDPTSFIARLTGAESAASEADDDFDQALEQLLRGETPAAPREDGSEPDGADDHGAPPPA